MQPQRRDEVETFARQQRDRRERERVIEDRVDEVGGRRRVQHAVAQQLRQNDEDADRVRQAVRRSDVRPDRHGRDDERRDDGCLQRQREPTQRQPPSCSAPWSTDFST
jgi:hypothetical protein